MIIFPIYMSVGRYLGDLADVKARIEGVKNQTVKQ
jgi:hypothetical protein